MVCGFGFLVLCLAVWLFCLLAECVWALVCLGLGCAFNGRVIVLLCALFFGLVLVYNIVMFWIVFNLSIWLFELVEFGCCDCLFVCVFLMWWVYLDLIAFFWFGVLVCWLLWLVEWCCWLLVNWCLVAVGLVLLRLVVLYLLCCLHLVICCLLYESLVCWLFDCLVWLGRYFVIGYLSICLAVCLFDLLTFELFGCYGLLLGYLCMDFRWVDVV